MKSSKNTKKCEFFKLTFADTINQCIFVNYCFTDTQNKIVINPSEKLNERNKRTSTENSRRYSREKRI
ncbi:hypothetical protein BSYN_27260 [Bacteroides sedimenti]|uniref:Uncharacterized protein n=1 Tax=Bacteroides sedimenti TaxID=2136147 RepID=A0ABN6Z7C8_9BACE